VRIREIELKNFRCFSGAKIQFDNPIVLIEGNNGSGKTSLIEAFHYSCYLRSFRTHVPRDVLQFGSDTFFIAISFESDGGLQHELQVGFSGKKRLIKLDGKVISSFKELFEYYRVITTTEDDLDLIKGGPDERRSFIDQAIVLYNPEFVTALRSLRKVIDQRNMFLQSPRVDNDLYAVWTQQLLEKSQLVQQIRSEALAHLSIEAQGLLNNYFHGEIAISFEYISKLGDSEAHGGDRELIDVNLYSRERRFGRSLFGAHLDDVAIKIHGKRARAFASRGQQKLLVVLLKVAQLKGLAKQKGSAIFLLDDFMTDFDDANNDILLEVLATLQTQLIFTCPTRRSGLVDRLVHAGAQVLSL
jgi:DNA replication and repair protein RecF